MSDVLTATKAFSEVQSQAEKIKSDETERIGTMSSGDVCRQGDLMIVCIPSLPAKRTPRTDRQLAPGTSQGSRHELVGSVELFDGDKAQVAALIGKPIPEQLIGPVFRVTGECELTHPEHGNKILPVGDCFAVVYQRSFAVEARRVLD